MLRQETAWYLKQGGDALSYEQTIYDTLRQCGLSQAGALGVIGNWYCESNCEPNRVQGDFSSYRSLSKQYVADITSGRITREQFAHDSKGFGIAQWTFYSRKYALYDYWKLSGRALDDVVMQTVFAMSELQSGYAPLLSFLQTTNDIFTATSRVCREFERPAVNNIDARFAAAQRIKSEINLDGKSETEPEPKPKPEPISEHGLKLRTVDKNCKGFPEIYLLQSALLCRGFEMTVDGEWTGYLTVAVKDFQMEAFPDEPSEWDCVVGERTWNKLLERCKK